MAGERRIEGKLKKFFDELGTEALDNATAIDVEGAMAGKAIGDEKLFDLAAARARIAELVSDDVRELILAAFESAVHDVGEKWADISSAFDREVAVVLGDQLDKIKESVDAVDAELKGRIQSIVQANADRPAAEIHQKLQTGLGEKFETLGDSRAKNIARTSATSATTGSQRAAWDGLEYESSWLAQPGARPTHAAASGIRPDDGGMFHVGAAVGIGPGNMSTAAESCNCRCTLRPRPKTAQNVKALIAIYTHWRDAAWQSS